MKIRLFVLPDGTIAGKYADILLTSCKLDPAQVRRVTNVEWSPKLDMWVAATLTNKAIVVAHSRKICLEMEGEFVDRLLKQFFMLYRPGCFVCPDCGAHHDNLIRQTCPACGLELPVAQEGFVWSDFNLDHLKCH